MTAPITPSVRAGDRERDQTANQLGSALAQGYLEMAEYETRLKAAFAAHTTAELGGLVADLPLASYAATTRAAARRDGPQLAVASRSIWPATWRWWSSCSPCG